MHMIVAVVRDEYATPLTDALTRKGLGATKLASTGGFLKAGSTTFLIGVTPEQLEDAMTIIRTTCPANKAGGGSPVGQPSGVAVGGATVFVLDVEKTIKA